MRPKASRYSAPPPGSDRSVQELWNKINEGARQSFWSVHIAVYGRGTPQGSPYPSSGNRKAYDQQDQHQQSELHADEEDNEDADYEDGGSHSHLYQNRSDSINKGTHTIDLTRRCQGLAL